MEAINLTLVIVCLGLLGIVGCQWLLIWRLIDRLLWSKSIPSLGPVLSKSQPPADPEPPKRAPLFSVQIPD